MVFGKVFIFVVAAIAVTNAGSPDICSSFSQNFSTIYPALLSHTVQSLDTSLVTANPNFPNSFSNLYYCEAIISFDLVLKIISSYTGIPTGVLESLYEQPFSSYPSPLSCIANEFYNLVSSILINFNSANAFVGANYRWLKLNSTCDESSAVILLVLRNYIDDVIRFDMTLYSTTYPILSNLGLSSFYPQPLSKECLDSIFIFAIGDLIGSSLDNSLIQNGFSTLPPSLRCIAAEIKTLYEYFVRQYSQFDNVSPRNDGEVTILINRPKRIGRK